MVMDPVSVAVVCLHLEVAASRQTESSSIRRQVAPSSSDIVRHQRLIGAIGNRPHEEGLGLSLHPHQNIYVPTHR